MALLDTSLAPLDRPCRRPRQCTIGSNGENPRDGRATGRWLAALRRLDERPGFLAATRGLRRRLPGDSLYGDPLSTAGGHPQDVLARQIAGALTDRRSVLREVGLGAIQVWQALSEAQGRGYGEEDLAIMFADLVGFSSWALGAGDANAIELLRQVDLVLASAVASRQGRVVKRLGDGLMAVFWDPREAVAAAQQAVHAVAAVEVAGYRPALRVGIHVGRPRRMGGDFLGIDVNIAARVAAAAAAGEVLVSESAVAGLDASEVALGRRRRLQAKGAPRDLGVRRVEPARG